MKFTTKSKKKGAPRPLSPLLSENTPFPVLEGYKSARTNLMFTCNQEICPILLFTSSIASEGKTTTCTNLAITFAQAGLKTLIIDADMRKPRLYKLFDLTASPGLSDVLAGFSGETCIHPSSYPNLSVMTSGTIPPNPAELMTSDSMDILLNKLRKSYDYIFIDTPPILLVTDAAVLANKVSGVVLVTRQKYSHTDTVTRAVLSLEQVGANLVGLILNDCDIFHRSGYRSYGKYGYSKYEYSKYAYSEADEHDT